MQYPIESARSSKEVTSFFGKSIYKSRKLIYNFEVLQNLTKGEIKMKNYFGRTLAEIGKRAGIKNIKELQDILNTKEIVFKKENKFDYDESSSNIILFHVSSGNVSDVVLEQINPQKIGKNKYNKIEIIITRMANTLSEEEVAKSIVSKLLFSSN